DKVDARSDVYSTGILLFHMLTGQKPFNAVDPMEVLRMHVEAPPPALAEAAPRLQFPPELEAVVANALAKDPAHRYTTAIAFAEALGRVLQLPLEEAPPVIAATRQEREDLAEVAPPPSVSIVEVLPQRAGAGAVLVWVLILLLTGALAAAIWFLG